MAMLTEPFFGGVFNYPILFDVQLYFWLMIAAVLVIVGSELFWRVTFWDPISPFHGLLKASNDGTKAVLVGDLNLDWALLSESAGTIIFDPEYYDFAFSEMGAWVRFRKWLFKPDFSSKIAAELEGKKEEPTLITIGNIPTHLIIDTEWWTDRKSPQRLAIKEAAEKWNNENPDDQVHRLSTFHKYCMEGKIKTPDGVKLQTLIPWARIDAAFPLVRSDAAWAGFVRQLAEKIAQMSSGDLTRWAILILVFCGAIDLLMFGKYIIFDVLPK